MSQGETGGDDKDDDYIQIDPDRSKMLAEKQKARGNAFLKEGKFLEAVTSYTLAINLDGDNHVYFRWQLIF